MSNIDLDLHIHSYYSCDGDYSPCELINMAIKKSLKAIALTDHNTIKGIPEFLRAGEKTGLKVIPGIEIDTVFLGRTFHILGYYLDWKSSRLAELTETITGAQKRLIKTMVNKLADIGFNISYNDVLKYANKHSIPGFMIIAKAIIGGDSNLGNRYSEFIQKHISPYIPCSFQEELPTTETAIQLINDLKGVPVLAHPGLYIDPNDKKQVKIVKTFKEMGLRGIEAFSTYHTSRDNSSFLDLGLETNLHITVGSDFHGELKPTVKLGQVPKIDIPVLEALNRYE